MSVEVVYKQEELDTGKKKIRYEWAFHMMGGQHSLVFHFFLDKGGKDTDFTLALLDSVQTIPNVTFEISYTGEFDGHDLVIFFQNAFAKEAIRSCVISDLTKRLSQTALA